MGAMRVVVRPGPLVWREEQGGIAGPSFSVNAEKKSLGDEGM